MMRNAGRRRAHYSVIMSALAQLAAPNERSVGVDQYTRVIRFVVVDMRYYQRLAESDEKGLHIAAGVAQLW